MAGDVMKKVQSGDKLKIPAETFNTFIDTARAFRADQQNLVANPRPVLRDRDVVLVKNQSGADRKRFDVLGIDDALITPTDNLDEFKNRVAFTGVSPVAPDHQHKFVVLLGPLADGQIGPAAVSGAVQARVFVNSADDPYCDIVEKKTVGGEDCYLGTGPSGAQILWMQDDAEPETIVWAIIRLGDTTNLTPFELKDDCTPGAVGLAAWSLQANDSGGFDDPDYQSAPDLTVSDALCKFRALGHDSTAEGQPGARGFCNERGAIVALRQQAQWITGLADEDVSTEDVTFLLHTIAPVDGGTPPVDDPLDVVNNEYLFEKDDLVLCYLDFADGRYHAVGPDGDERVKVTETDAVAGYLDDKIVANAENDEHAWIETEVDGEADQPQTLRIKHGDAGQPASPDPTDAIAGVELLASPGGGQPTHLRINSRPFVFDRKGHFYAASDVVAHDVAWEPFEDRLVAAFSADALPGTLDEKLSGDGAWITVSNDVPNLKVKIEHAGPGEYADFYDPSVDLTYNSSTNEIEISYYKGKFDARGHFCDQGEQTTATATLAAETLTFNEMRVSGGKLQQRTRTIRFIGAVEESEPSWTDLYDIGECQ